MNEKMKNIIFTTKSTWNRSDQQGKRRINKKRHGIGFVTVAGMGEAIVGTITFLKLPERDNTRNSV